MQTDRENITNEDVKKHFDDIAKDYQGYKKRHNYYFKRLLASLKEKIPEGKQVYEIGCGTGEVLEHLKPSYGYGTDISPEMIKIAAAQYKDQPNLHFEAKVAEDYAPDKKFDYILLIDVIEHLANVDKTIETLKKSCKENTVFYIWVTNPIMSFVSEVAEYMKWKMPEGPHNWIGYDNLKKLLVKHGFDFKEDYRMILPVKVPVIGDPLNDLFYKVPLMRKLGYILFLECKLKPGQATQPQIEQKEKTQNKQEQ